MEQSKHYFQLKGANAEEFAFNLAQKCFLEDWCYLNPKDSDGSEICDLLVVYDRVCIVFQVKSLKLGAEGRYKQGKVDKNIRQVYGAKRRLTDMSRPLELQNPRRGVEEFEPSVIERYFLISVLVGDGESVYDLCHRQGDNICHMFTGDFLEKALNELDTVHDFVSYLSEKEDAITRPSVLLMGGEEELLAHYIVSERSFSSLPDKSMIFIDEGCWDKMKSRPEYIRRERENKPSYYWDSLIEAAHTSGKPEYERIARELARPGRFDRRILGKALVSASRLAHRTPGSGAYRRVVCMSGTSYCFLFQDIEEVDDGQRAAHLYAMCIAAHQRFSDCHHAIGIAMARHDSNDSRVDMVYIPPEVWDDLVTDDIAELVGSYGFFKNEKLLEIDELEFPEGA